MVKYVLPLLMIFVWMNTGYSQSDTIMVSEGKNHPEDDKYDTLYKMFVKDQEPEISHLWKINLVDLAILMPNLDLEQKLGKLWSSDSYFKLGVELKPSSRASGSILDTSGDPSTELELEQQFKYYLNLIKHEKPGGKNHGFTGDYFSIGLFASCRGYTYDFKDPSFPDFTMSVSARMVTYGAGIKYGLQRRIGNIGYFDVFAGMNYQVREVPEKVVFIDKGNGYFEYRVRKAGKQEFMPMIGIRAGFAIDSNSKLMKILK